MQLNKKEQFLNAYDTYADALFRFCYFKIGDREMAKDLLQETYVKTWTYLAKGEDIGNIRAFLYRTARNLVIDEYRKRKMVSLDMLNEQGMEFGIDQTKELEDRLDSESLLKLISKIPESYGEVVFMRYVMEFSLKEISEVTKKSQNSVAVTVHRGLEKLKKLYIQGQGRVGKV